MTEKRFTLTDEDWDYFHVKDNLTGEILATPDDYLKKLNELDEELANESCMSESQLIFERNAYKLLCKNLKKEYAQLKKSIPLCWSCKHEGYAEVGSLCELDHNWNEFVSECEDYEEGIE